MRQRQQLAGKGGTRWRGNGSRQHAQVPLFQTDGSRWQGWLALVVQCSTGRSSASSRHSKRSSQAAATARPGQGCSYSRARPRRNKSKTLTQGAGGGHIPQLRGTVGGGALALQQGAGREAAGVRHRGHPHALKAGCPATACMQGGRPCCPVRRSSCSYSISPMCRPRSPASA